VRGFLVACSPYPPRGGRGQWGRAGYVLRTTAGAKGGGGVAGRVPKLDAAVQKRVCDVLRDGNTRDTASRHAGVSPQTFCTWMAKGRRAAGGMYREFLEAVKKAEREAEMASVKVIRRAAPKNWCAAAWWLERRRNRKWGKKDVTKVVGAGKGGEIVVVTLGPGQSMGDL
jgi:hypothetical protein